MYVANILASLIRAPSVKGKYHRMMTGFVYSFSSYQVEVLNLVFISE